MSNQQRHWMVLIQLPNASNEIVVTLVIIGVHPIQMLLGKNQLMGG